MAVNGHVAVDRPVNPVDSRGPGDDHDLLLIDASERIVYADGPSVGRTADSAEGIVGLHVAEVLSPRLPAGALHDCREALAGHTSASTFESLEGDDVWSFSATPVTGDAGDVVAAVAVMRRITDDASRRRGGAGPRRGPWTVTRDAPVTGVVIERARTVLVGDGPGMSMVDAAPVARGAMLHRLAGASAPLMVMRAPAGYGKTTVLHQWAAAERRPVAWVDVTDADNDPDVLLSSVTAAVTAATKPAAEGGRAGRSHRGRAAAAPLDQAIVLVLDHADVLVAPEALAALEQVIERQSAQSQVAIACRSEIDLPLGRLMAQQRLAIFGADDLAMSAAEAKALFEAYGIELESGEVEALVRHTEGWPMALRLAAMALLRGGGTVDALIEAGGREAWLAQYLRDEFLRDLPAEDARFLAVSGPLGDVSGAMCDAVMETHGSAETLRRLSQSNSLLFPLDQAGESYHVHRLLQEMLASDLARSEPDLISSVYARAGDWWDEQGAWQRAVRFARAAGNGDRAGALMIRHVPDYAFTGQSELGELLDEVPAALTRTHPTLALARAWTTLPDLSNDETPMWAALAEQGLDAGDAASGEVDAQVALNLMRAVLAEQGCGAMAGHAAAARGLAHPAGPWAGLSCYVEGSAAHLAGDLDHSTARLEEARRLGGVLSPALRALTAAQLALNAVDLNERERARALSEEAEATVEAGGLGEDRETALVDAVSALTRAQAGNESAARMRYRMAMDKSSGADAAYPWLAALVKVVLARTALHLGDGPAARTLLLEARMAWRSGLRDASGLQSQLETLRATLDAFPTAMPDRKAGHLTPAELRVLRLLPTHLSFRQIGEQLFLSRHTVKTEAISTYRKLGVTSRSEAVERARELSLL